MKLYKLTDQNGQTRNATQWGPGVTHRATGSADQELCSDGWLHAYEHPLIAVFMNPIHSNINRPRLWEAAGDIGKRDGVLKCGCRELTTVAEMELPVITTAQWVRFAIACAWPQSSAEFRNWATGWLNGSDCSEAAAQAAEAAEAAAATRARAAEWAAWVAEWAAEAASHALSSSFLVARPSRYNFATRMHSSASLCPLARCSTSPAHLHAHFERTSTG